MLWHKIVLGPLPLLKKFWILYDAVQKICAGFSEKVRKKISFFLFVFCRMCKFANIISYDYVKLCCRYYDTTLVALGNGL